MNREELIKKIQEQAAEVKEKTKGLKVIPGSKMVRVERSIDVFREKRAAFYKKQALEKSKEDEGQDAP